MEINSVNITTVKTGGNVAAFGAATGSSLIADLRLASWAPAQPPV